MPTPTDAAADAGFGRRPAPGSRGLLLLTLAGLAARILFLLLEPATRPVADERTWTNWAVEALVTPRVRYDPLRTHLIFYPPLYPYFIAVPYDLFGTLTAVKWAQALLGTLLVPAVGRIGARLFGAPAGLAAAALVAFYPDLVWFSAHFWSETLFMVLLWWSLERLLAADAAGSLRVTIAAALLWGLSILTRETLLYATPLAGLWLALRAPAPRGARRGAVFVLVSLLTVAPWTYRNWLAFHAFVPVSTAGGLNLFQGNARLSRQQVYDLVDAVPGRVEQYHYAQAMGIAAIVERAPGWIFEKLREELPNFLEADSLALIHVKRGAYGPVSPGTALLAAAVVLLPYLASLALALPALAALQADRARGLLILLLAYYVGIHVATHGFARYRLPVMPVVFLLAGVWLAAWRSRQWPALRPRAKALMAALALVVAACLWPSFEMNYHHRAFGFVDTPPPEEPPPLP